MQVLISALVAAAYAEAEADPAVLYGAYGYAGLGAYPGYAAYSPYTYGYGHGYAGLKSAPCVNAANVPVPCAAGYHHAIGKRDAEADAAVLYSNYGYAGLGYGYAGLAHHAAYSPYTYGYGLAGLKSAPCVNAYNIPVPCAGRKKRSAEADAEADAAVLYSNYGYAGLGYGLGAYSYGAYPYAHAAVAHAAVAAPVVAAAYAAPAVAAPVAAIHANTYLGHAVAATPFGLTHSSNVGVCTNYLGAQVSC